MTPIQLGLILWCMFGHRFGALGPCAWQCLWRAFEPGSGTKFGAQKVNIILNVAFGAAGAVAGCAARDFWPPE